MTISRLLGLGSSVLVCVVSTSVAQVDDRRLPSEPQAQKWVAAQLMADHMLYSAKPTGIDVDPSGVVVYRVDSMQANVHAIHLIVIGEGHDKQFTVLRVNDQMFRLAGFSDPQVFEAWSAVRSSTNLSCQQVSFAVLRALDPNGESILIQNDSSNTNSGVELRFTEVMPDTWPRDGSVLTGGMRLDTVTLLSRDRTDHHVWTPTVFALATEPDCRLAGWQSRVGSAFRVDSVRSH